MKPEKPVEKVRRKLPLTVELKQEETNGVQKVKDTTAPHMEDKQAENAEITSITSMAKKEDYDSCEDLGRMFSPDQVIVLPNNLYALV